MSKLINSKILEENNIRCILCGRLLKKGQYIDHCEIELSGRIEPVHTDCIDEAVKNNRTINGRKIKKNSL